MTLTMQNKCNRKMILSVLRFCYAWDSRVIRFNKAEVLYNIRHVIHVINQQLFHTE